MNETEFYEKLLAFPDGAVDVDYQDKRYLLRKKTLLQGRLIKIYAKNLSEGSVISGNYYPTMKGGMLRPCEISDKKVIDFVLQTTVL